MKLGIFIYTIIKKANLLFKYFQFIKSDIIFSK